MGYGAQAGDGWRAERSRGITFRLLPAAVPRAGCHSWPRAPLVTGPSLSPAGLFRGGKVSGLNPTPLTISVASPFPAHTFVKTPVRTFLRLTSVEHASVPGREPASQTPISWELTTPQVPFQCTASPALGGPDVVCLNVDDRGSERNGTWALAGIGTQVCLPPSPHFSPSAPGCLYCQLPSLPDHLATTGLCRYSGQSLGADLGLSHPHVSTACPAHGVQPRQCPMFQRPGRGSPSLLWSGGTRGGGWTRTKHGPEWPPTALPW